MLRERERDLSKLKKNHPLKKADFVSQLFSVNQMFFFLIYLNIFFLLQKIPCQNFISLAKHSLNLAKLNKIKFQLNFVNLDPQKEIVEINNCCIFKKNKTHTWKKTCNVY